MTSSTRSMTPLRQRMIEDMRMRKLAPKTQTGYIRAVRQLAGFLGRSPDTATVDDLRRYQLHLVDLGMSPGSLNATLTGLKFFFEITLDHQKLMAKMQPVHVPHKLPVVLSREEVARLIASTGNLKHHSVAGLMSAPSFAIRRRLTNSVVRPSTKRSIEVRFGDRGAITDEQLVLQQQGFCGKGA